MAKKYKYYNLEIDGPDKTGKSTLCKYLTQLSNYRFATHDRGYLTQVVYSRKFNRNYSYEKPSKKTVYILLTVDKQEHDIRCKITNEPKIDFESDMNMFEEEFHTLVTAGYHCLHYNTTHRTFYDIAKNIIDVLDRWEDEK